MTAAAHDDALSLAAPSPRRLDELGLAAPPAAPADALARGLTEDSRKVAPGWVFFALDGVRARGADFAPFALRQGALAVVCSAEGAERIRALWAAEGRAEPPGGLPLVVRPDPRLALARAAAVWFGEQPRVMAAVTGTNGKTSTASFLRQIWTALGRRAVNIGTTGVEGAVEAPLGHTTPDPLTLHRTLAALAARGVDHAVMEASSHGLVQRRLDAVRLRAAALTNITRDHMDYHRDHDDYVAAKLKLFDRVLAPGGTAVLNTDDPAYPAARLVAEGRRQRVLGVGRSEEALLRLLDVRFTPTGQVLRFHWAGDAAPAHEARLELIGAFQGMNALMAAGLAIGCGEEPAAVFAALEGLRGVRGRMELVARRANGAPIYVDYAHTPDGLSAAIAALRPHVRGRVVAVFGAGGDRDAGKRPLMGRAALAADAAIVTDDNPRSEDPAAIRAQILAGMAGADPAPLEIGDRAEAILAGADMLGPEDCLLIAGKGHETGQIVAGRTLPFDDAAQALAAVAALDGDAGREIGTEEGA
ncbi:UDP-N-acetylmuramoyl-L-alanyl-D-glutamate--2,6-diaminopimelate ligase [Oceanicella actignis]|uniref:UDP-N-acetylmuramoyl-L-alanyl-D-glutamate--2, 6-diaminopimelate ligase n=1 Tax=Oceanicella actignis TaxID=1189325 RepID=UPI0011E60CEB|nr:UDP-N-acetylmuramoyl-L-alanyl-D-glutamate--2,6-diaminopimelate ligase [Oceanicella actignis]TYO91527.1 UDP-N-acetylmuramoylalanyl-D-glutamate--2,6-diaminopimelate ligase [Oceanicella actignis]